MNRRVCGITSALAAAVLAAVAVSVGDTNQANQPAQLEPWADARLPVTAGLSLWLDAGRQSAARKANGRLSLVEGEPLDVWYDGSGNALHLTQGFVKSRPTFHAGDGGAAVRFDGVDDCLGATGPHLDLDEFTVFVLTAPRSNAGSFRAFFSAAATGKNDYQTGLNIDQGGTASEHFSQVNVEGKGFGGMVNLMTEPQRFGEFHVLAVRGKAGKGGIQLFVDGT